MAKSGIAVAFLLVALVASNAAWLASFHRRSELVAADHWKCGEAAKVYDEVVLPLIAAITMSAKPATREEVIAAAKNASRQDPRSCIGDLDVVPVRGVGLKFNSSGDLSGATTAICAP